MKRGFTLVEIMIVTAIFATMMVAGTSVIMQVMQISRKAQVENELHQNLSLVFETISRQVRKAGCLRVINNGSRLHLYSDTGCSNFMIGYDMSGSFNVLPVTSLSPLAYGSSMISPGLLVYHRNYCSGGGSSCAQWWYPTFFEASADNRSVKVSIQIFKSASRWDRGGSQIATESTSIRQFSF